MAESIEYCYDCCQLPLPPGFRMWQHPLMVVASSYQVLGGRVSSGNANHVSDPCCIVKSNITHRAQVCQHLFASHFIAQHSCSRLFQLITCPGPPAAERLSMNRELCCKSRPCDEPYQLKPQSLLLFYNPLYHTIRHGFNQPCRQLRQHCCS